MALQYRVIFPTKVIAQVIPTPRRASIRGPKYSTKKGKTAMLTADKIRQLFKGIDTSRVVGLRDHALIGTMVYMFARVSAVVNMTVEDFCQRSVKWRVRLHERAESSMRYSRTIIWQSTCTSTSVQRAYPRRRRRPSAEPPREDQNLMFGWTQARTDLMGNVCRIVQQNRLELVQRVLSKLRLHIGLTSFLRVVITQALQDRGDPRPSISRCSSIPLVSFR